MSESRWRAQTKQTCWMTPDRNRAQDIERISEIQKRKMVVAVMGRMVALMKKRTPKDHQRQHRLDQPHDVTMQRLSWDDTTK